MSALQIVEPTKRGLSPEAKQRAREMFFKGVPNDVLEVIWSWADRYGLDVFAGHITALPFKDKKASDKAGQAVYNYVPYVTRDGALHHAMQSGLLVSFQAIPGVQMSTGREYCEVFVYRRDTNIPTRMTLFMDEWKPKDGALDWDKNAMWKNKPSMMLQKTAIRQAVLQAIPLTVPVLSYDTTYFETVMNVAHIAEVEQPQITPSPSVVQIEAPMYPASQLLEMVDDPTSEPETPAVDPEVLEKARVDVAILGEHALGADGWQARKSPMIRGIKPGAATLDDLGLEELARLTATLTALKMTGNGKQRL